MNAEHAALTWRCDCCGKRTPTPAHRVKEFGGELRMLTFCKACASCWSPRSDGTIYVPPNCPHALRPTLRVLKPKE